MTDEKDKEIARLAALVQDLEQQNVRIRKENSFLQAMTSTLNMNANLAEANLSFALECVERVEEHMRAMHANYLTAVKRATTDTLGFPCPPKDTGWESN